MGFFEKKKRKFGDRKDGHWVKDVPGLNVLMSCLYPNRCDCEVCLRKELDITEVMKYIDEKNKDNPDSKLKFFHCIIAMMVRIINQRPYLNRFVRSGRVYIRDEISVSFVAKRMFNDQAEEALVTYIARADDNIDKVKSFVLGEVKEVRKTDAPKKKSIDNTVNNFAKLPCFLLLPITGFVRWLDLELPVDRERKGRGHCIDLIGRASDNSMVICELKFGKPGNGKPSEAQEQLEEYYHAVKENYDRLDEGNSLHHKNTLNAGSFYWEEIASDSTIRIIAANDDYWNYWRKKDVLPAAGSKCYTVPVPTTLFKMQKEQCAKDRYTPSVSNLEWRFVK